ncbi:MAG: ABC transporter ATP-binding protein/permease [Clostridiales Family XIII bacterium]|jgi:ABC-type lipoprotein export system ATPase subunit|nr:ABC transporter ATP-binding protein/permease [Clostridiales Family XIII bacterium]
MLQLTDVRKSYTTADFTQVALDDVSIAFRDNEYVAILGPSGSGKTTLLNIIGGLDHYDSGNLVIDGISTEKYTDRDWDTYRNNRIGFVFQSYNLIPHQTVLANVELALTLSGVSKAERRERAIGALDQVGLKDHIHKRPNQMSGGQMQRVAIARALINDPEILLADEPTGALDSKTSVHIMELLTEIANDRLVIMVTHNPDLAEENANRIINLSDGMVVHDSNPFVPEEEDMKLSDKPIRRTVMSFFTALALSFNNLMTKKGRTFMTAFAGSIGIIGIAAILSLANGVNHYIKSVEEDTLSVYPLTIDSTGVDFASMMMGMTGGDDENDDEDKDKGKGETAEDARVKEMKMISNMFSKIGANDLAALKKYFDSGKSGVEKYSNSIEYSYNVTPQIYSTDTEGGVHQVNPDSSFSALGLGSNGMSGIMSMGMSTNAFYQMMDDSVLIESQYDVVSGHWPESYDECVLVLTESGGVSDFMLYAMDLRDPKELEDMVRALANGEDVVTSEEVLDFSYDEVMDVHFRLVKSVDYFRYDETYKVWTDQRTDSEFMKTLVQNGIDLRIAGIVKPNPDTTTPMLTAGLYYTEALTDYLMEESAKAKIVQDQLAAPSVNVFTGKTFESEAEEQSADNFDMSSMFSIDEDAIAGAFKMDPAALNVDMAGMLNLDPAALAAGMPEMPELDLAAIGAEIDTGVSNEDIVKLMTAVMLGFPDYCASQEPPITDPTEIANALPAYLSTPEVQGQLTSGLTKMVDTGDLEEQVQEAMQTYMQGVMETYMQALMANVQVQVAAAMQGAMAQLTENMAGAMSIDQDVFAEAFQFNMSETELQQLMLSFMGGEEGSSDNNLKKLGYANPKKPSSISIYPIDFEGKEKVIGILDNYNKRMEKADKEDQVITYTDIVGALMTSVTDIINKITAVLVAFVAISLVVSSIMIGIITYISVLERKKEIGILRSIGASKRDISNVFNAETLIVGFVAGLLGVLVTALITIPVNIVVHANFDVPNIAVLPWNAAIILVLVSMGLSFLAGLIPSSAASRKDPVEALRSE